MTEHGTVRPGGRRRRWLKRLAVFLLIVVAYFGFVAARWFLFQSDLEVGRETTFVDGPLRPDGTIDYVAALNDEWSQGVTPENNAAVTLMETFGPSTIAPPIRAEFFERLGINALPEEGDYLLPIDSYLTMQGIEDDRQEELFGVVGTAESSSIETAYPELADWVERNKAPLERIVEAGRREQFFTPVLPVAPARTLIGIDLAMVQHCREAVRLLNTAAMLYLQRGDVVTACEYAVAGHRLGRLVCRHSTMIAYLTGLAIDQSAARASEAILLSEQLSSQQVKQFRRDIDSLPPLTDVAEMVDRSERLVSLSGIQDIVKGSSGTAIPTIIPGRVMRGLDANVIRRDFNRFYDETVAAMRVSEYRERRRRLGASGELQQTWLESKPTAFQVTWLVMTGSRSGLSRQVSKIMIALLFPAIEQIQVAEDRTVMKSHLLRVAAALAEYRAVEGIYPESLDALRPTYLDEIPADFYADAPLKYERVGETFLLYSVGQNGKDDGGLTFGEGKANECDDIRMGRVAGGDAQTP